MNFITFEGPEGSGKSTQSRLLKEHLERKGFKVRLTREPGGTWIGEAIRKILLDPKGKELVPECELLLYLGVRALHVRTVIGPAIDSNEIIICDRFMDATVAYQGYGRGIDIDLIHKLNDFAVGRYKPDITFIIDVNIEEGLRRAISANKDLSPKGKADRMEGAGLEFHKRVMEGYREIAKANPERVRWIEPGGVDDTSRKINSIIDSMLGNRG